VKKQRLFWICTLSFAIFTLLALLANTGIVIWLGWRLLRDQGSLVLLLAMVVWTSLHATLAQWVLQCSLSWRWDDDDDDDGPGSPESFSLPPLRDFQGSCR